MGLDDVDEGNNPDSSLAMIKEFSGWKSGGKGCIIHLKGKIRHYCPLSF